jgi:O-antigen/teichoic acid export membrane protein
MLKRIYSLIKSNEHTKKFASFGGSSVLAIIVSYFTMYMFNSELSKTEMGEYANYFNLLNLMIPLLTISLYSSYLRFSSTHDLFQLENFVKKRLIFSFVAFLLLTYIVFDNFLLPVFGFIILYQERLYYFRSTLNIKIYNLLNVGQKLLFLIMAFFVIKYGAFESNVEVLLCFLGLSYSGVWLFSILYRQSKEDEEICKKKLVDDESKKLIIKFCVMVMLTDMVNWVLAVSDQILIKFYFDAVTLAPYSVSFRIVSMIGIFTGIFLSYYPVLYFRDLDRSITRNIIIFRRVFFFSLIFFVVILGATSDYVFMLFGASKYLDEKDYFYWLLGGEFFRVSAAIFMTYRTFKLQQKYLVLSLVGISILNIFLNILFLKEYGPLVAAYSTFASYLLYFVVAILISYVPELKYFHDIKHKK